MGGSSSHLLWPWGFQEVSVGDTCGEKAQHIGKYHRQSLADWSWRWIHWVHLWQRETAGKSRSQCQVHQTHCVLGGVVCQRQICVKWGLFQPGKQLGGKLMPCCCCCCCWVAFLESSSQNRVCWVPSCTRTASHFCSSSFQGFFTLGKFSWYAENPCAPLKNKCLHVCTF